MIETIFTLLIGFLVGWFVKKSKYIININLKQNGTSDKL